MELKGIKGIDTFVQNTEPSTKYSGDVWIRPGKQSKLVWSRDKWNRPFWKDVVSKILWGAGCEYGYVCGDNSTKLSLVERLEFPFDGGNLAIARVNHSGCNSSNYGFCCGSDSIRFSSIERFSFPFNSGTASHVGNLNQSKISITSCNSSNYSYTFGGDPDGYFLSTIERFSFPFNSGTASHVGNLSNSRDIGKSFNNSNYGYCFAGYKKVGDNYYNLSDVERITFPFDSGTATHVGNLSATKIRPSELDGVDFVTMFV